MAAVWATCFAVSAALVAVGARSSALAEAAAESCAAAEGSCRAVPRQAGPQQAGRQQGPGVLLIQKKLSAKTDLKPSALEPEPREDEQVFHDEPVQAQVLQNPLGWPASGQVKGGDWCKGEVPLPQWTLMDQCPRNGPQLDVSILSYNLFWWNLFDKRGGNGGSAGKLIAGANSHENKFDVMGFQECDNIDRVLQDTGFPNSYGTVRGPHAVALAYRRSRWNLLASGNEDIAEDAQIPGQYYGRRCVVWARLQHWSTGKTMLFLNHHGPLPVNSGGKCGGEAVAYNLLRVIGHNGATSDLVVIVGDFNAGPGSAAAQTLRTRIQEVYTGRSFGGVDHIFSSCATVASTRNLGGGGSDHDAITATVRF